MKTCQRCSSANRCAQSALDGSSARMSAAGIKNSAANSCACVSTSLTPHRFAVHDQMAKLVGRVEPRARPVTLVGAEDDHGPVGEGQGEGVQLSRVQRKKQNTGTVLLEYGDNVRYGASCKPPG